MTSTVDDSISLICRIDLLTKMVAVRIITELIKRGEKWQRKNIWYEQSSV